MIDLDWKLLDNIADITGVPGGAFNLRKNGQGVERHSTDHVIITSKADKPGINIIVLPGTKGEQVHIPVIITETGVHDVVYNDFEIGDDADVTIVAGCGIHNCGSEESRHDGIHKFHLGKNAHVKYVEKHYGEGDGSGDRVLNPTTIIELEQGAVCEMEMVQIKGVTSTVRKTEAHVGAGAKLVMTERLMTHGKQVAKSDMDTYLDGEDASVQIISRSVARDDSTQVFHPRAVGNAPCRAHIQCDSIIMDTAKVSSIPEIAANHAEAQIVHEAAIGRINNDQLMKMMTFGMTETQAEEIIIQGFLE